MADYWITLVTPKLIHVSKTRTDSTLGPLGLRLCRVQLTETKTNASNSSGDWMTQVNRVVAHTSVALVGMSICPISF